MTVRKLSVLMCLAMFTTVGCGGLDEAPAERALHSQEHILLTHDQLELAPLPERVMATDLSRGPAVSSADQPRVASAELTTEPLQRKSRCIHNNTIYWPGQVYPVGDGCNVCLCNDDGDSTCTLVDCETR